MSATLVTLRPRDAGGWRGAPRPAQPAEIIILPLARPDRLDPPGPAPSRHLGAPGCVLFDPFDGGAA